MGFTKETSLCERCPCFAHFAYYEFDKNSSASQEASFSAQAASVAKMGFAHFA
jgi:hypothetical protein